jgi:hypothetical protein
LKRSRQLNIALFQSEFDAIQARADALGVPRVDYARATLLSMQVASIGVGLPSKLERLNLEQMKRIGNNLNQIARGLNALGQSQPEELSATLSALRAIIDQAGADDR